MNATQTADCLLDLLEAENSLKVGYHRVTPGVRSNCSQEDAARKEQQNFRMTLQLKQKSACNCVLQVHYFFFVFKITVRFPESSGHGQYVYLLAWRASFLEHKISHFYKCNWRHSVSPMNHRNKKRQEERLIIYRQFGSCCTSNLSVIPIFS